jgi:phage recombination protein Bet
VVQAQKADKKKLVHRFAERYGIDPAKLLATLKATAFKQRTGEVSDEQMMALLVVAEQYHLNPFTKEIYAYPDKNNGIVPVVGVDGWSRIINEHPNFDGMDFVRSETVVTPDMGKPCPEWIECVMHRKDRSHPTVIREDLDEVYRPPFMKDNRPVNGPWQSHTKRMLRHKAIIQCARIAFGFVGIFDEDEAQRIIEAEPIDVTPDRPRLQMGADGKPQFVNADGSEYVKPGRLGPKRLREVIEGLIKHSENNNGAELLKIRRSLSNDEWMHAYGELRSWEATAVKKALADAEKADAGIGLDAISIESLRRCTNAAELEEAWRLVQDAYADNGTDVPETVTVACDEVRSSMGAV